jgi:hypothetical protein
MGSFRFKNEIDKTIRELKEGEVSVLGPDEGDLNKSEFAGFWPLDSERKMTVKEVEDNFINQIYDSDFVYIVCPDGYIGDTVTLETGICIANGIPIYSSHQINIDLGKDLSFSEDIEKYVRVNNIQRVIEIEGQKKLTQEGEQISITISDEARRLLPHAHCERR